MNFNQLIKYNIILLFKTYSTKNVIKIEYCNCIKLIQISIQDNFIMNIMKKFKKISW